MIYPSFVICEKKEALRFSLFTLIANVTINGLIWRGYENRSPFIHIILHFVHH